MGLCLSSCPSGCPTRPPPQELETLASDDLHRNSTTGKERSNDRLNKAREVKNLLILQSTHLRLLGLKCKSLRHTNLHLALGQGTTTASPGQRRDVRSGHVSHSSTSGSLPERQMSDPRAKQPFRSLVRPKTINCVDEYRHHTLIQFTIFSGHSLLEERQKSNQ